jgi:hypothetical protein
MKNPIREVINARYENKRPFKISRFCADLADKLGRTRPGVLSLIGKSPPNPDSRHGVIYGDLFDVLDVPAADREEILQELREFLDLSKTIINNVSDPKFSAALIDKMPKESCEKFCSLVERKVHAEMLQQLICCSVRSLKINKTLPCKDLDYEDIIKGSVSCLKSKDIGSESYISRAGDGGEPDVVICKTDGNFKSDGDKVGKNLDSLASDIDLLFDEIEITDDYKISIICSRYRFIFPEISSATVNALKQSDDSRNVSSAMILAQSKHLTLLLELHRAILADSALESFFKRCVRSDGKHLLAVAMKAYEFPEAIPMLRQVMDWGWEMKAVTTKKAGD